MQKEQNQFFVDLARRFGREGIECDVTEDERLVLKFDGQAVGFVTPGGSVRILPQARAQRSGSRLKRRM